MSKTTKELVKKTIDAQKETTSMKTSNERGGGLRFNTGKPRFDLVQADAHRDMVMVLTAGANKYADRNWEIKGMNGIIDVCCRDNHVPWGKRNGGTFC